MKKKLSTKDNQGERLRWALRYILCHPQLSPDVMSKEWNIDIENCIDICSYLLAEYVVYINPERKIDMEEFNNGGNDVA